MNGFQEMAIYILDCVENGEIKKSAVSAGAMKKLGKYKVNKYYVHNFCKEEYDDELDVER
jgi:hypothetical protein